MFGVAACGARTGLVVPSDDGGGSLPPVGDAGAQPLPPIHATPVDPSQVSGCADAGSTVIYIVSEQGSLLSFDPPTATLKRIGTLGCPVPADATPFSMAVDRAGIAYVLYNDGELFRVSTATAACRATGFVAPPTFTQDFGMGYSTNAADGGEVLYVADKATRGHLAILDTTTLALHLVGSFDPSVQSPELTGTGAGDLFAFYATDAGSAIAQIDRSTAHSIGNSPLLGVNQNLNYAFAIWGGDFYTFTGLLTAQQGATEVTRFRPRDGSIVPVGQIVGETIVGAGVSTCAPQP